MKTKHIQYETQGTCSKLIDVTADENNIIQQVFFLGGCTGKAEGRTRGKLILASNKTKQTYNKNYHDGRTTETNW